MMSEGLFHRSYSGTRYSPVRRRHAGALCAGALVASPRPTASQFGEVRRSMRLRSPLHMSGVRTLMWTLKHSTLHDCLGFLIAGALPDHR